MLNQHRPKKEPTCDHREEYSAQSKPVERKIMSHVISFSSFISLGTFLPSDLETFRFSRPHFQFPQTILKTLGTP